MDIYKIAFIGHRDFSHIKELEETLPKILLSYLKKHEYVEFYIGRNGIFDITVASIIKRIQKDIGNHNNCLILVLPYPVRDTQDYEKYYDEIVYPLPAKTYYKRAITARNQWLVEYCDLLIAYTEKEEGGAYATCTYAKKKNKPILQLAPST